MKRWIIDTDGNIVSEGKDLIEVYVGYNKGGTNYFTYKFDARGYYAHVTIGFNCGGGFESFEVGNGFKVCMMQVERRSAKKENAVCKIVEDIIPIITNAIREHKGNNEQIKNSIGNALLAVRV